jgi:prepilin-type N-terminal cleavage/methylation domain-containing protein
MTYQKKYLVQKSGAGFTLIESLFAVFIIGVGLVGAISVITQILDLSIQSSHKLTAAYLAQEGIEIVRNIRDSNWLQPGKPWDFDINTSDCNSGCEMDYEGNFASFAAGGRFLSTHVGGFYSYSPGGTDSIFKRKITVKPGSTAECQSDCLEVIVDVTWPGKGCGTSDCKFIAQENIYRWYTP